MDVGHPARFHTCRRACTVTLLCITVLAGCRLAEVKDQVQRIDDAGVIAGRVITQPAAAEATIVAVFHKQSDTTAALFRTLPTTEKGTFALNVAPGEYYVSAFIDRNGDGHRQQDEPGAFYGAPTTVTVAARSRTTISINVEADSRPTLADKRFLELMNRLLAESVAARPAAMQASWFDDWLGKWIGPEGTFLELSRQGDGYIVTIQSLDGPARYHGRAVRDHIEFRRDGKSEAIRATGGKDTGMKWLLDKQRCLTVKVGEGYCRG